MNILETMERYRDGLAGKFPGYAVAIAYLTPFNRKWAMDKADDLATVREFDGFQGKYANARHISWLDIAAIPWDGNELWRQHQLYVHLHLSPLTKLHPSEETVTALWGNLSELGIPVGGWRLNRQRSNGDLLRPRIGKSADPMRYNGGYIAAGSH